jgi:hypothetical protein
MPSEQTESTDFLSYLEYGEQESSDILMELTQLWEEEYSIDDFH